jgi:hypothetical protein
MIHNDSYILIIQKRQLEKLDNSPVFDPIWQWITLFSIRIFQMSTTHPGAAVCSGPTVVVAAFPFAAAIVRVPKPIDGLD